MALLSTQQIAVTGTAPTYSAANASETVVPDDRTFYHVKVGGTATTVTVVVPGSQYGQARPDVAVGPLTSADRFIGPLVSDLADPTTGLITINLSQTTGVTGALLRI